MKDTVDKLLDNLVAEIKDPKVFTEVKGQLLKRGGQALLQAEMDAHLGYQKRATPIGDNLRNGYTAKTLKTPKGDVTFDVPRDRNSTFDPVTVPKHQTAAPHSAFGGPSKISRKLSETKGVLVFTQRPLRKIRKVCEGARLKERLVSSSIISIM